jgi:threonine dehydratase
MKSTVQQAQKRIAPHIRRTECRFAPALSGLVLGEALLKLENTQVSGSFKLRGVMNKILSLSDEDSQKLLVTASTGNHAAAFAHAIGVFGLNGKLFMAKTTAGIKIENIRSSGIPFELVGDDPVEAEAHAAAWARANGHLWISPYNDPAVVAGQGTVGVELMEQLETIDAVLAPVGGGGLIGGVAAYLKAVEPSIEVIGCQPVNSCVMYESVKAGRILDIESLPTVSDGTAGGIEENTVTLGLCQEFVDDFILLEEEEIIAALRVLHEQEGLTVEGAAALPAAAILKQQNRFAGRKTVLIVSGGRVDTRVLERILGADRDDRQAEKS